MSNTSLTCKSYANHNEEAAGYNNELHMTQ